MYGSLLFLRFSLRFLFFLFYGLMIRLVSKKICGRKRKRKRKRIGFEFSMLGFSIIRRILQSPNFLFFFFCSSIFLVFGVHDYIKFVL